MRGTDEVRAVDQVDVHVLVDNVVAPLERTHPSVVTELAVIAETGMPASRGADQCSGHHGLSLVVTARDGDGARTILFDAGPDPCAIERNGSRHTF